MTRQMMIGNNQNFFRSLMKDQSSNKKSPIKYLLLLIPLWPRPYEAVLRLRCAVAAFCLGFAFSMLCLSACIRSMICARCGASGAATVISPPLPYVLIPFGLAAFLGSVFLTALVVWRVVPKCLR